MVTSAKPQLFKTSKPQPQLFTEAKFLNKIKNRHRFYYIYVRLTICFHISNLVVSRNLQKHFAEVTMSTNIHISFM